MLKATKPDLNATVRTKSIVYGVSKIGKSPVLAKIPNAYIIDTEKSMKWYKKDILDNGSVYLESTDVKEIREQILELQSTEHPYTTLVIDSLSYLYDICSDKWTNVHFRHLKDDISELEKKGYKDNWLKKKKEKELALNDFGFKYWGNLNGEMRRLQYLIGSKSPIDMNIIVVSYEDVKEFEDKKTKEKTQIIRAYLPKRSEHIYDFCIRVHNIDGLDKPIASVSGKGEPIKPFVWNIENLKANILKEHTTQAVIVQRATPEQIKFILENKDENITPEQDADFLVKLGINQWDEIDKKNASKMQDYLQKLIINKNKKLEKQKQEEQSFDQDINM
jgi:hypothetical protein